MTPTSSVGALRRSQTTQEAAVSKLQGSRRSRAAVRITGLLAAACAVLAFGVAQAVALPDGRAYEQVTPVDKNGADIGTTFGQPVTGVAVAADGTRAAYFSATPFDGTSNGLVTTWYRSTRGSGGWATDSLSPPLPISAGGLDIEFSHTFNSNLSLGIFSSPFGYDPADTDGPDAGHFPASGWYDTYAFSGGSPVLFSRGTVGGDGHFESFFVGASNDLSHVVFESQEKLLPSLPDLTGSGYYVYERSGGTTQLVNVDGGGALIDTDGATVGDRRAGGGFENNDEGNARNAVSDDGSKVVFESPYPGSGTPTKVYLRDTVAGTTTNVSPNTTSDALFAGASADASKIFFLTTEALTGDDLDTDNDLYMYDVAADTLTRVSHGSGSEDANVAGVAAVSDNGSHVYFVAMNQLGGNGTNGQPNLFRYDTGTDTTAFVATLSGSDSNVWSDDEPLHAAFTTPNGRTLAFLSVQNLTSYDAQGHREVYVYRILPQGVVCASCRTNGTAPTGDADLGFRGDPGFSFGWVNPLTDDGSRVFFNTSDTLNGNDVNGLAPGTFGQPGSQDVYEWDGVPKLISDGESVYGSALAGVSPSGNDVFFYTRSALVSSDVDGGENDIYDARVGGGFPPPASQPAPCDSDACHGAASAAPFLPVPATLSAQGGNVNAPIAAAPTFTLRGISRAAAARAARTGRLVIVVHVTAAGRITAVAKGRVARKTRRVASTSHTFRGAGTARMTLKLSRAARAQLRRAGRLRLSIDVSYSVGDVRTAHVTLRRSSK